MEGRAMTTSANEWKASWTLVLASFIGFVLHSMPISALSTYIGPLEAEFGWSRTFIAGGISIGSMITAIMMPFIGAAVDRYGSRRVVLPGLAFSALTWSLIALVTGEQWQWFAVFIIHAVFNALIAALLWTTAVAGAFSKSQGMAIGVTLAGATAAHAFIPPASVALVDAFGWRIGAVLLALGLGLVSFVLCYFFFYDRRDRLRVASKADEPAADEDLPGLTLGQAARSLALWQIGISTFVILALTIGFLVHQIEILQGVGVSRTNAAWLSSLSGMMGIVGKLVTGWLIDRYRGDVVGGLTMAAAGLAFAMILGGSGSSAVIVFAMLVNGYTAGAKLQIASYLTVRYGGLRNFGKIYGVISSTVSLGAAIGPLIAGALYDATGSYNQFLVAAAIGLGLSALLLITLPRYPDWDKADKREGAMQPG
jgi:predicted MFS family arabinose efflux permease